ncbi:MAG TPA: FAD-dependent oxidoreductase [Pontiellaceae bacterium]|nr:FAD-dependent oxidoreductase [Pontiellaceae bacterium]
MRPIHYLLFCALSLCLTHPCRGADIPPNSVLLEAEAFQNTGGWVVDSQFMDLMGSPFLMAHGLGEPVTDAATTLELPEAGTYRVWVRTRDWVAPWNVAGAPGKFQLVINGQPLPAVFGTEGANWHWQDGGTVTLAKANQIALHDLTGFNGRCDAIFLCRDQKFTPPDGGAELAAMRQKMLGWTTTPADGGQYDIVVAGGGVAGICAAITAARDGLKVALVQDRPVLGGNSSSEIRVWPEGETNFQPFPRIGDVGKELLPATNSLGRGNAKNGDVYEDAKKLALVRAETNITLFLEQRINQAQCENGKIQSVVAQDIRSGRRQQLRARWFVDATGDGVLGTLAGADSDMIIGNNMGSSNLWNVDAIEKNEMQLLCERTGQDPLSMKFTKSDKPAPFPRCPWAVDLAQKPFPGRKEAKEQGASKKPPLSKLGGWAWESGFGLDPIQDMERIRDQNLRAMFGAWDALKNVEGLYPNYRLKWSAYIAGKRESRRLLGDVVLTAEDFRNNTVFPDPAFPCSWRIDLHSPDRAYVTENPQDAFISNSTHGGNYKYNKPYWAPYRTLYSRNVANLFMAGRDISVNHEALGPVRVMRTTGMMGEVVGMAAGLCKKYDCTPREVYEKHLEELQQKMRTGSGKPKP